jgi:hypothetical protein
MPPFASSIPAARDRTGWLRLSVVPPLPAAAGNGATATGVAGPQRRPRRAGGAGRRRTATEWVGKQETSSKVEPPHPTTAWQWRSSHFSGRCGCEKKRPGWVQLGKTEQQKKSRTKSTGLPCVVGGARLARVQIVISCSVARLSEPPTGPATCAGAPIQPSHLGLPCSVH